MSASPDLDAKSDEDAYTVVSESKRRDYRSTLDKMMAKRSTTDAENEMATEAKLLAMAENAKETFLFQKKHLETVVSARLKKLDNSSGACKKLRNAKEKIQEKQLVVEDLSTDCDELTTRCKSVVKELKSKKKALPGMKKTAVPNIIKELKSSADAYKAPLRVHVFILS